MKFRQGFVSNSSSSSFLVVFNKPLESYNNKELASYLFNTEDFAIPYEYFGEERKLEVDILIREIREYAELAIFAKGAFYDEDKTLAAIKEGCDPIIDLGSNYNAVVGMLAKKGIQRGDENYWESFKSIEKEINKEESTKFFNDYIKNTNNVAYYFHLGDDGLYQTFLEQGRAFENLPHVCVNHH